MAGHDFPAGMALPGSGGSAVTRGFSLVELIFVVSVISILIVIAVPGFKNLMPARKTQTAEIFSLLDLARARALSRQQDVYVCFADGNFPIPEFRFRACAIFEAGDFSEESEPIDTRRLVQVENWMKLPSELVFATTEDFPFRGEDTIRTVLDFGQSRNFQFRFEESVYEAPLPYLLFNRVGRLEVPYSRKNEVHVGVIEGRYDTVAEEREVTGSEELLRGDLLSINAMTGKITRVSE